MGNVDSRESLRVDMGALKLHELKAAYQLVERLIDSNILGCVGYRILGGLVQHFDDPNLRHQQQTMV